MVLLQADKMIYTNVTTWAQFTRFPTVYMHSSVYLHENYALILSEEKKNYINFGTYFPFTSILAFLVIVIMPALGQKEL